MNDFFIVVRDGIILLALFYTVFYWIPYMIRKGWGDAENKTKKVCDVCFRDISKWNKFVKEAK